MRILPIQDCSSTHTKQEYLGDGVYAKVDAAARLVLTTENGIEVQNEIIFEPEVVASLLRYLENRLGYKFKEESF